MQRRLLLATAGGGSFTVPEEPPTAGGTATVLTTPNHGGWVNPQHPKAIHYNGYSYIGYIHGSDGYVYVVVYNHATETAGTPIRIEGMQIDDHNNPALFVRDSDHRLMAFFCLHDGPAMYLRISSSSLDTDPTLANGWGSTVNLDSQLGSSDYTYPVVFQFTSLANDPIYLFYRDYNGTSRLAYSVSTDDGSTWSTRTLVYTGDSGHAPYWTLRQSGNRIDVMTTDRDAYGLNGDVDMGHFYIDVAADTYHTSDGTEIEDALPFLPSAITPLESNVDAAFTFDGIGGTNPVFTYMVDNGDSTVSAKYARWDGAEWDVSTVYTAAHPDGDRFFGGLAINHASPTELFSSVVTDGTPELFGFTTADSGATWSAGTAYTTESSVDQLAPISVWDADATLPVVWLYGTFTSQNDFDYGIKGLVR